MTTFSERRPWTFDRVTRLVITISILGGIVWLISILKDVLLPFCAAALIAYILEPFVQFNKKILRCKSRVAPVLLTLFETVLLLTILSILLVPSIMREINDMARIFNAYASSSAETPFIPKEVHEFIRQNIDFKSIAGSMANQDWMSISKSVLSTSWGIIAGGFAIVLDILNWLIAVLYIIFIMIDYDRLGEWAKRMVPRRYRPRAFQLFADVKNSMNRYFRGQALVALCVGVLFSIGFLIVGLPMAIVLGLFIGLLNMVPYLQFISIVPTTLLCLVFSVGGGGNFWTIWWECIAVYCIVQVIQDLILTPRIMGKVMGLNPAIILLSLSIWGTLLGMVGLIIALPLTTLLLAYYEDYVIKDSSLSAADKRKAIRLEEEITELRE